MKKILAAAVLLCVGLVFYFDLHTLLSLQALKASLADFKTLQAQQPAMVVAVFFAVYVLVAALSIPGAVVMTLAAGALFGLWQGVVLVSFASTLGATLAFLAARYLLRETVLKRFGPRMAAINKGLAEDGAFYLFTLRLVPVFPFFLINLLLGLTQFPAWRFFWVSQLGMLAGTVVYVNAGTELAKLNSVSGIVSPPVLGAFVLLAVFPWLAKKVLQVYKTRRLYRAWPRPKRFDRNLIVIGAGAAGLVSAYIAAAVKAKVTLVEAHKMGGDCLNYGCVPSKALIRTAKLAHQIRQAGRYGLQNLEPRVGFREVMQRVQQVVKDVAPHDSIERYTSLGVDVQQGHARLLNPWTVRIDHPDGRQSQLTARSIVIAAGAAPVVPNLPGLAEVGYLTSDTLWEQLANRDTAPARLVVLGGGPIGCELAQAFARLGSQVTLVEKAHQLMVREDPDVAALVHQALVADGVRVLLGHEALRAEVVVGRAGGAVQGQGAQESPVPCKRLVLGHQGAEVVVECEEILCALGRSARLSGYGLEALGIPTQRTVVTNEYLETVFPNIYAAGDVAGPYQFTHTAAHQAWYAVVNALFGQFKRFKVDYRVVPHVTFTDPELARVGLNENEARAQGLAYEVTRYGIDDLDRAIAESDNHGMVKVLTTPGKDRILGATVVGPHAGELLAEFALAMKHGLGLNAILSTIHSYPTWAEANKYAAGEWKRQHAPQALLRWVQRYHAWRLG